MSRRRSAKDTAKIGKAKRDVALARVEFRTPSEPRLAPSGPTSFPVKARDESIRRMIDEALARKHQPVEG